jgi:hypothetical protein
VLVSVNVGVKLDVAVGALVGVTVSVSLGRTKKVAVREGVLLGVVVATCATMVGRGVLETKGVGLGVRVGAIVGVTSGTDKLQAASSKASRITLRRIIPIPQIHHPLKMIIDTLSAMRDGRIAYASATG